MINNFDATMQCDCSHNKTLLIGLILIFLLTMQAP